MQWLDYLRFRDAFAEALDPRLHAIEHVDAMVLSGAARLFRSAGAAILVEIRTYPTGTRALHGLVGAGALDEIVGRLIPAAEQWARSLGCTLSLIESRPGWARVMRKHGYAPFQLAIAKDL